jgi:Retrotransposon gag protein
MDHDPPEWLELIRLVRKHFNRSGSGNAMEDLLELRQTGTIDDYIELFERLHSKLLLENQLLTEIDLINAFVGGLKHVIRAFVNVFKTLTLDNAFECAIHMEGAVDTQYKKK